MFRHKRETHLNVAIILIVIEECNNGSCRFIIESVNITAVMIKAVKLVFSWQFVYGSLTQQIRTY